MWLRCVVQQFVGVGKGSLKTQDFRLVFLKRPLQRLELLLLGNNLARERHGLRHAARWVCRRACAQGHDVIFNLKITGRTEVPDICDSEGEI